MASSSSALALPPFRPPGQPEPRVYTYCVALVATGDDGSLQARDCDETANNQTLGRKLNQNGCADEQASIKSLQANVVHACLPVGATQL